MRVKESTFLAGIPIPAQALKAVTMQADRVFSFRSGKIASRLYGVTIRILGDTSLATKDDSCCEFYTNAHKFRVSDRRWNLFCMAVPYICWSLVWNLLHITLLAPRILKGSKNFKNCATLVYTLYILTFSRRGFTLHFY